MIEDKLDSGMVPGIRTKVTEAEEGTRYEFAYASSAVFDKKVDMFVHKMDTSGRFRYLPGSPKKKGKIVYDSELSTVTIDLKKRNIIVQCKSTLTRDEAVAELEGKDVSNAIWHTAEKMHDPSVPYLSDMRIVSPKTLLVPHSFHGKKLMPSNMNADLRKGEFSGERYQLILDGNTFKGAPLYTEDKTSKKKNISFIEDQELAIALLCSALHTTAYKSPTN